MLSNVIMSALFKRLPTKYHDIVENIEQEDGLIDDCKYMLYIAAPYDDNDLLGGSIPVRNLTEAIQYVKDVAANYKMLEE